MLSNFCQSVVEVLSKDKKQTFKSHQGYLDWPPKVGKFTHFVFYTISSLVEQTTPTPHTIFEDNKLKLQKQISDYVALLTSEGKNNHREKLVSIDRQVTAQNCRPSIGSILVAMCVEGIDAVKVRADALTSKKRAPDLDLGYDQRKH